MGKTVKKIRIFSNMAAAVRQLLPGNCVAAWSVGPLAWNQGRRTCVPIFVQQHANPSYTPLNFPPYWCRFSYFHSKN
jgi:hypothetical protein